MPLICISLKFLFGGKNYLRSFIRHKFIKYLILIQFIDSVFFKFKI